MRNVNEGIFKWTLKRGSDAEEGVNLLKIEDFESNKFRTSNKRRIHLLSLTKALRVIGKNKGEGKES
jgi:hypothetical protein